MNGDSKRQIASDLGIARDTVSVILDSAEFVNLVNDGKAGIYRLIPKSVKALDRAITRGKTTEEAQLVLRSTGVLAPEESGAPSVNVNFGVFGG